MVVYFGAKHIEILHDRFLQPLLDTRKERRTRENEDRIKNIRAEERRRRNKRLFIIAGIFAIIASLAAYFFVQEKNKVKSYNSFFEDQNKKQLEQLRENVEPNSIGALMNIIDYEESVTNLPVYKKNSSEFFRIFNDSIYQTFKDKGLVFLQEPEQILSASFKGNFIFTSRTVGDTAASIIIFRLGKNGYQPDDSILFHRAGRNQPKSEVNLSWSDQGAEHFDLFTSRNDSLLTVSFDKKVFVYELFKKHKSKYKKPIDSLPFSSAFFSLDSRFLLAGDDNDEKNIKVYRVGHQNNNYSLTAAPWYQKSVLGNNDFSFAYVEDAVIVGF